MHKYVIRRLLMVIPILFGVSLVVFFIMRMVPGDVATMILMGPTGDVGARQEDIAALREKLGLDRPLAIQYLSWVGGMLTLNVGDSLWSGRPIFEEVLERFPLTLELAALSIVISVFIALLTGILAAVRQNTWIDYVFRAVSIAGLSVPNFWLGTMVILILSRYFFWSPPLGYTSFTDDPLVNLQQMIWPAVILGYSLAAVTSRMTRSSLLEVLREDYIRTAWAKGLSERIIVMRHAFRNALLPVLTLSAIQLGTLLGGTVIMETIFTLPGIGRYLVDSVFHRDYPVTQTIITIMAVKFVFINLIVDLLYGLIDPRIRYA
ncbi:MAG TPA: ABC transporter permease [Alphaproteobacteria bacterium]|nr:ABC transporter permease [Alphaproteobacteria bacterium]